jgi:PKD repeat protein
MKKVLVVGIIVLFIGMNIVSSTVINVEHNSDHKIIDRDVVSEELLIKRHIAYSLIGTYPNSSLYEFEITDLENLTCICEDKPGYGSITWLPTEIIIFSDIYGNIYKIDPETCEYTFIGSTGTYEITSLSYDPSSDTLFGISTSTLYKIDMETGNATLIGAMGTGTLMVTIDCAYNGTMYGIDLAFTSISLYIINTTTGIATKIGNLGISLQNHINLAFDKDRDVLYVCYFDYYKYLYMLKPIFGSGYSGTFQLSDIFDLTIPFYYLARPVAQFNWTPPIPAPEETIIFNASKSYSPEGNVTLYEWDWDNDGNFDESYNIPTATHSWSKEGHYKVTLRVTDDVDLKGKKTETIIIDNEPPGPPTIAGPTGGKPKIEYAYTFVSIDPNDQDIKYYINWGDGDEGWTDEYYPSGKLITFNHTWKKKGTYTITSQAMDTQGYKSKYSTFEVNIPRDKKVNNRFLFKFLDNFPLLNKLLNIIRR